MAPSEFSRSLACANHLRKLGLTPLPSKLRIKGPMLPTYADHYGDVPVPEEVYQPSQWRTTNLQVITGVKHPGPTKIVVIDLDGEQAKEAWSRIESRHCATTEKTWTASTGSGGTHLYYRLPPGMTECPGGMLWALWDTYGDNGNGRWVKHCEVRLLADHALVVSPPSLHVETGRPYWFWSGLSPNEIRLPAMVPDWILNLPRLCAPRCDAPREREVQSPQVARTNSRYRRQEVLDAIPDKVALVREWGLRMARDKPNPKGWVSCYAVGRNEVNPSGSFHASDGVYQDRKDMRTVSLLDLGVELRPDLFADWREARDWCGDRWIGEPTRKEGYGGFGRPA